MNSNIETRNKRTMKMMKVLSTVAIAAIFATSADAQITIFTEGFETQTLGTSTAGTNGSTVDDTNQFAIQNWGTFNNTDQQNVSIVNTKVSPAASSTQSAYYRDQDAVSAANMGFQHNFLALNASNPGAASYDASQQLTVSFDMLTDFSSQNPSLFLTGTGGTGIQLMTRRFDGALMNRASGSNVVIGSGAGNITTNTWYNYTLTINDLTTATDTYDLVVTNLGTSAVAYSGSGLAFNTNVSDLSVINFQNTGSTGTGNVEFYVDNISVTQVPEPSTALLLGMGLGGLFFLRRYRAA